MAFRAVKERCWRNKTPTPNGKEWLLGSAQKYLRDKRRLQGGQTQLESELLRAAAYTALGPPNHGARPEEDSRSRGSRALLQEVTICLSHSGVTEVSHSTAVNRERGFLLYDKAKVAWRVKGLRLLKLKSKAERDKFQENVLLKRSKA